MGYSLLESVLIIAFTNLSKSSLGISMDTLNFMFRSSSLVSDFISLPGFDSFFFFFTIVTQYTAKIAQIFQTHQYSEY